MATPLFFSTFEVTRQAFHRTTLAHAIVNLKPIVPGRTSEYVYHLPILIHDNRPSKPLLFFPFLPDMLVC